MTTEKIHLCYLPKILPQKPKLVFEESKESKRIPLNQIYFHPWNIVAYNKLIDDVHSGNKVKPVEIHYCEEKKLYDIQDGNHRCFMAYILGMDYVEAIVTDEPDGPVSDIPLFDYMIMNRLEKEKTADWELFTDFLLRFPVKTSFNADSCTIS